MFDLEGPCPLLCGETPKGFNNVLIYATKPKDDYFNIHLCLSWIEYDYDNTHICVLTNLSLATSYNIWICLVLEIISWHSCFHVNCL